MLIPTAQPAVPAVTPDQQLQPHTGGELNVQPVAAANVLDRAGIPVKSGLKLDKAREDWLVTRVLDRMGEVDNEQGIIRGGLCSTQGWMWYRENYQMQYDGDFRWREQLGGIFQYSNHSLNISKRFVRLLHAKSTDNLLGTDPFFSAMQKNDRKPKLAKQSEWYLQENIGRSNFAETNKEGLRGALIRGEAITKSRYVFDASPFIGPAMVLCDGPQGQPRMTKKGMLIYRFDDEIPDPNIEGATRLSKDPTFEMPPENARAYRYFPAIPQVNIRYQGLGTDEVFYKDFGCPLKHDTIQAADINFHVFDESWDSLKERYEGIPESANYFQQGPMSGKSQPNTARGEEESVQKDIPMVNVGEFFIRIDADNDKRSEEIWIVIDIRNKKAIWYDYSSNHMHQRPFNVLHGVEKVAGRWYGVGVYEMLATKQIYVDTQFNRLNWKSSKASSLRFYNSTAVKEWASGVLPVMGDDQFYDVADPQFNKDMPPAFEVHFGEQDPVGQELMTTQIASAQVEVGIMGPTDSEFAGNDAQKTATGVKNLERTGNQLEKAMEQQMAKDIERGLDIGCDTILMNMDVNELVFYPDAQELITLNPEEIRNLNRSITLTLSRTRSTETLENSNQVITLCTQYYALTPFLQFKLRPEYIRQLKALEVQDADELLDEVTQEEVQAWQKQQADAAAAAQEAQKPPNRSVAAKLSDLAPSERDQWIQSIGITPATPEEVFAKKLEDVKLKQAEKPPVPEKKTPAAASKD